MKQSIGIIAALLLCTESSGVFAQACAGGSLRTHDAYLYGRFETRMQSAQGNGIVSAFFLFNADLNCNWPAENNEIDIEMTGNRDASVQFTTHYPSLTSYTEIVPTAFNPHLEKHDYAFEWEPGIVRWFIDGNLVYTQDAPYVNGLVYPMRIMMNLWAAQSVDWVGTWDPSVMPKQSFYDYVRYYSYTPGSGDAGSNNNFTLQWADEFDTPINTDRWDISEFGGFGNNYCTFITNNVSTNDGQLQLRLTQPPTTTYSPVHFSVDASSLQLTPSDTVYLNGTFNGWCGNCNPMADPDGDDVWDLTLSLPSGNHEYLYTTNGWNGETGGAPQGSDCDFLPCDQYTNYGVSVPYGAGTITTDTYKWASCEICEPDQDNDGIPDTTDNCPAISNPLQNDNDGDLQGDACDTDDDNDGLSDFEEENFDGVAGYNPLTDTDPLNADSDNDGISDFGEINYDGNPEYDPATDTNPLSSNSDGDAYPDASDPVPLNFNHEDGNVAPWGTPDSNVDTADLLVYLQFLTGHKTPSNEDLARGDLHPVGAPDGIIGLADYLEVIKTVLDEP